MGFMTEISVLNDQFDQIERNPARFVEDIKRAMNGDGGGWCVGQTTVHRSHHADDAKVYLSARNSFTEAYPTRTEDARSLAWRLERLTEMRRYIAFCTKETKRLLEAYSPK